MDKKHLHDYVSEFLSKADFGVLATLAKDGSPSTATVIFVFDEDFNFYIPSHPDSHKYENCKRDNRVSFTVYSGGTMETIQLDGTVELLEDVAEKIEIAKKIEHKVSNLEIKDWLPIAKMKGKPVSVIKIIPSWMRYASFGGGKLQKENEQLFFDVIGKTKGRI